MASGVIWCSVRGMVYKHAMTHTWDRPMMAIEFTFFCGVVGTVIASFYRDSLYCELCERVETMKWLAD